MMPFGFGIACSGKEAADNGELGKQSDSVFLARTPDNLYRDVGFLRAAGGNTFCTATAISDTVVVTAAHCGRIWNRGQVPGQDDEQPYSVARQARTTFTIDMDGDAATTNDQFIYAVGRRYAVLTKVNQPTGTNVVPMDDTKSAFWDLAVLAIIVPPGTIGPKTRSNTKARRLLTGYKDNLTPAGLTDLVVHAQFDPLTWTYATNYQPVMQLGFGANDIAFLPDGGINTDASLFLLPDGGLNLNDAGNLPNNAATQTRFRLLAPAVVKGQASPSDTPVGTLPADKIRAIVSGPQLVGAPFVTNGDSGSPMILSTLPNLPANTDAIMGVASTGPQGIQDTRPSKYAVAFHPEASTWIEGRLRTIKADALVDLDFDGVPDRVDNCISVPNPNQTNTNIETEYELACRAGACPPNDGEPPAASATAAQVATWRATFRGDACDTNSAAKITLDAENPDTPVQVSPSGCMSTVDHLDFKVQVPGACYQQASNDIIRSDGYRGDTGPFGPDSVGHVSHYACNCAAADYAGIYNELQQQRKCQQLRSCQIALDSAQTSDNAWFPNRMNLITESNVVGSMGSNSSYYDLLFTQPDRTLNALADTRAGQRRATWDLASDFVRMSKPTQFNYEGMLWSFSSNSFFNSALNTPNDYALTTSSRYIDGLTTLDPLPLPKTRIPWYEWVMNPGAHRGQWAEVFSPIKQTDTTTRGFVTSEVRFRDASKRFTPALLDQLSGIATGATIVAFPPADAIAVNGNNKVRAVTLAAATGIITGYVQVASGGTDAANGTYSWVAFADPKPLGIAITAASFEPRSGRLAVVAAGKLRIRLWNGSTWNNWTAAGSSAAYFGGATAIQPYAGTGITGTYRAIAPVPGVIYVADITTTTAVERAKWDAAPANNSDSFQWVGFGRESEVLVAFPRSGASNSQSGVLAYANGEIRGFNVPDLSGPATTDPAGGLFAMVSTSALPAARLRKLARKTDVSNGDEVSSGKILGWLANP